MLINLEDVYDLAAVLELDAERQLIYYGFKYPLSLSYRSFPLQKKTGGTREINAPKRHLGFIQAKIQKVIQETIKDIPSPYVYSYKPGCSAKMGAARHIRKPVIIKFDIEDFFGTINFGRVRGMFMSFPFRLPENVATVLAQLCCYENKLPQGAPTSPIISNIICRKLDRELSEYARRNGFAYTRYADDMTFSARSKARIRAFVEHDDGTMFYRASENLSRIISTNGFRLNHPKTKVLFDTHKQMVTGIICNEKINVDRRYIRRIRTLLHLWSQKPTAALEAYNKWKWNGSVGTIENPLRGMILYVRELKGEGDSVFLKLARAFNLLCSEDARIAAPFELLGAEPVNMRKAVYVVQSHHSTWGATKDWKDLPEEEQNKVLMYKIGTGFFVKNVGFVTSFHNLQQIIKIFPSANVEFTTIPSVVSYFDPVKDFAIFENCGAYGFSSLTTSAEIPVVGENISFYGFPAYQSGDDIYVGQGVITQKRNFDGQTLYAISENFIQGQSGGPVLNSRNEVIGLIRSNYQQSLFVTMNEILTDWRSGVAPERRGVRSDDPSIQYTKFD